MINIIWYIWWLWWWWWRRWGGPAWWQSCGWWRWGWWCWGGWGWGWYCGRWASHLIPSPLTCHLRKFFSTVFISSEHWSTFLISKKFFSSHLSCSARQKKLLLSERSLLKTIGRREFLHTDTWDADAFTQKSLSEILCTTKLAQSTSQYYLYYKAAKPAPSTSQYHFAQQSLHALPSTTLYYKACT